MSARRFPPRDIQPQLRQLRQLGEPRRFARLDLHQLPKSELRGPVFDQSLLLAIVRLLGAYPGAFELIVAEHRPFGRAFAGYPDPEVEDGSLTIDHEGPVPPLAGFPEFERHM